MGEGVRGYGVTRLVTSSRRPPCVGTTAVVSAGTPKPENRGAVGLGGRIIGPATFSFDQLLTHLEEGERSLATIPVTIWTGRIPHDVGTDAEDLSMARCIAADRDFPAPDSRAPMLVVLTDRRLLLGQAKQGLRCERGLRRVLGEVSLDRIVGIEPTKVVKGGPITKSCYRLALVCLALIWVIAQAGEAVDRDWSLLENTPVWLPDLVVNVLGTILCLIGFMAFVVGTIDEYMGKCFVVEVELSNGKSILLQLHGDAESFLSAFRRVSNSHLPAS